MTHPTIGMYDKGHFYFYGYKPVWKDTQLFVMSPLILSLTLFDRPSNCNRIVVNWGDGESSEDSSGGVVFYHRYDAPDVTVTTTYTVSITYYHGSSPLGSASETVPAISMGRYSVQTMAMYNYLTRVGSGEIQVGDVLEFTSVTNSAYSSATWDDQRNYSWEWEVSVDGGSTYLSLEDAVSNGYIDLRGATYSTDASTLKIAPKVAGSFRIISRAWGLGIFDISCPSKPRLIVADAYSDTISVYSKITPSIGVLSITPATWSDSDPNHESPLLGRPPYTVTFKDTSLTTTPGQFAITSRLWTFGDANSGALNNSILEQQDHTFSGYGPYSVKLEITNTRGESASVIYQFTPEVLRRVITDTAPTPEPDGEAPLLVTCNVVTAGNPTPVTTWAYSMANDPGYYSGSKIGDYAELSLLAPGTYTITRTVSQDNQEALTKSWTITVTAPTPVSDTPVSLDDFVVWLYNSSGTRIAIIDMVDTPRILWNAASGRVCSFRVSKTYEYITQMRGGTLLAVGYLNIARPFVITRRTNSQTSDFVEFECIDYAEILFESRVALVATQSTSGNGYDVQTCSGEALMRYFAVANIQTSPRTAARFVVLGTNSDLGGTVSYSARYEDIASVISDLCTASGLGWDVSLQSDGEYLVGWAPVAGSDHTLTSGTNAVIFSTRLGTATIGDYAEQLSKNTAIGAGRGVGATRPYTIYNEAGQTDPTMTDIERREVFVDSGDAADAAEVKRMAVAELKNAKKISITVYPLSGSQYVFGTDYKVGDWVTIEDESIGQVDLRIITADYARTSSGTTLELTCGTDQENYTKLIKNTAQKNTYARK